MGDKYNQHWELRESTCMGEKKNCMGKESSFYSYEIRMGKQRNFYMQFLGQQERKKCWILKVPIEGMCARCVGATNA